MDHLPIPKSSVRKENDRVPYLCRQDYDGGPFLSYPERVGITPKLCVEGAEGKARGLFLPGHKAHLQALSKHELEPFLQTWLFFGLIHEFFGSHYDPEDYTFVVETDIKRAKFLSTSGLVEGLDIWVSHYQPSTIEPRTTYDHLAECLCLAFATLEAVKETLDPTLKLSLSSLGEILEFSLNKAVKLGDYNNENHCPATWPYLIAEEYWEPHLLASGWCKSEVRRILDDRQCIQSLHYHTYLTQPLSHRSHRNCNNKQCGAFWNDLATYKTQHVNNECNCEKLSIDTQIMSDILERGSLPLLHIKRGNMIDELSVDIVSSAPASRYVALSHVWADGLGNPWENAWPRCQLFRLHRLIHELDAKSGPQDGRELLFWCDTLCCPSRPEHAKRLALARMPSTYQAATHVLVLEASLLLCHTQSLDPDEACLRMLSSGWMRRLWTLPEGTLPAAQLRLWFQFMDKAINMSDFQNNILAAYTSSIGRRGLAFEMTKRMAGLVSSWRSISVAAVENSLRHRSVSVPSDEPLLIGLLLGLDVMRILDGPKDSRMNRMWSLASATRRGIPQDIIFRIGPRLREPGFRWAPATLLAQEPTSRILQLRDNVNESAVLSKDGLLVRRPGRRISLPPRRQNLPPVLWNCIKSMNQDGLYMRGAQSTWYTVKRRLPVEQDHYLSDKNLCATLRGERDLELIQLEDLDGPEATKKLSFGLITERMNEDQDTKFVQTRLHILIGIVQRGRMPLFESAFQLSKELAYVWSAYQVPHTNPTNPAVDAEVDQKFIAFLHSELDRVVASEDGKEALRKAEQSSMSATPAFLKETILWWLLGNYANLEEDAAQTQLWCID